MHNIFVDSCSLSPHQRGVLCCATKPLRLFVCIYLRHRTMRLGLKQGCSRSKLCTLASWQTRHGVVPFYVAHQTQCVRVCSSTYHLFPGAFQHAGDIADPGSQTTTVGAAVAPSRVQVHALNFYRAMGLPLPLLVDFYLFFAHPYKVVSTTKR